MAFFERFLGPKKEKPSVTVELAQPEQQPLEQEAILREQEVSQTSEQQKVGVQASSKSAIKAQAQPQLPVGPKTQTRKEIEEVLSDGLIPLYQSMTPDEQVKFRNAGNVAAAKIEVMVTTFKATAKKIVDIIRVWLLNIPRVNNYFLEQESKLKTDQILDLQKKLKNEKRIKSQHQ